MFRPFNKPCTLNRAPAHSFVLQRKASFTVGLALLLATACTTRAQYFFAEYHNAPLLLNPANTGRFPGDYRLGGSLRNENTVLSNNVKGHFFADYNLPILSLPDNDRLSIGLAGYFEKDNFNGISNNSIAVSVAYHKALDREGLTHLIAGFQAGLTRRKLTPPKLITESQLFNWINYGFVQFDDPALPQPFDLSYANLNAGLAYQRWIKGRHLFNIGLGVLNINKPSQVFDKGRFGLYAEWVGQAGIDVVLHERAKLLANINLNHSFAQNRLNNLAIGCIYQTRVNDSRYWMNAGAVYRKTSLQGSALAPALGIQLSRMNLLLLYSMPLAKRSTAARGGIELGMVFSAKKTGQRTNK